MASSPSTTIAALAATAPVAATAAITVTPAFSACLISVASAIATITSVDATVTAPIAAAGAASVSFTPCLVAAALITTAPPAFGCALSLACSLSILVFPLLHVLGARNAHVNSLA